MDELRGKTVVGSYWALLERFGYLGIQFISNLVMARLLMPDDFGTVGILTIFTSLSYLLIDCGLSVALIQKQIVTEEDKSTVFFSNLAITFLTYAIVYLTAPLIAEFFHNSEITYLLRAIELVIIFDAFASVQNITLRRDMNFKALTGYKIESIIIAVIVSLVLAYAGWGVWALVIQYLLFSFCRSFLLCVRSKWKPIWTFSRQSLKSVFDYSLNLFAASSIASLYDQLQTILLGRLLSTKDMGYYSQASLLMRIPVDSMARVVNDVSFPAYSKIQNNRSKLKSMARQNLSVLVFINTPLMFYLSTFADPLLVFLYSDKWLGAIPYFQFLCVGCGVLSIIHNSSTTVLKSVGRADYILRLEVIKRVLGVCLIFFGMHFFGIWGILYSLAFNIVIELFLNGYYLKNEIGYGAWEQIKELFPPLLLSIVASFVTRLFFNYVSIPSLFLSLLLSFAFFSLLYFSGAYFMKINALKIINTAVRTIVRNEYTLPKCDTE